ncbi:MAG: ABC transporter substrate-binding protein [Proteobacteria bacterium]|nr:ABC transporter substrate-binding protein [Pseudomonadota bacterium]
MIYSEENAPLNFTDTKTGHFTGASTELIAEIMRRGGVVYSIQVQPWKRSFRSAQENANACVYSTVWSQDRDELFQWVGPIFTGGWAIYKRRDSDLDIQSIEDLSGHTIAALAGTAAVALLRAESDAQIITAPRDDMAAALLYHGRAKLWLSGVFAANHSARTAGVPTPSVAFIWKPSKLMLACNKGVNADLIAKLNAINSSLNEMRAKLMDHYNYGLAADN